MRQLVVCVGLNFLRPIVVISYIQEITVQYLLQDSDKSISLYTLIDQELNIFCRCVIEFGARLI